MDVKSTLVNVFEKADKAFENELPFVVYRHPESNLVKGVFQKNKSLFYAKNYTESGFVFAPFDNAEPAILFPLEDSTLIDSEFSENSIEGENNAVSESNSEISKAKHIDLVKEGIEFLHNNDFKKVVLSRKESVRVEEFKVINTFKKLLSNYKNAFVYCWFHPKVGLWLGATPETLLKVKGNTFSTMALAATQVYEKNKDVQWKFKEVQEQQYVTDFILEQLNINVEVSKPYTIKAGNLLHLRTDISGTLTQQLPLKKIINLLHPTPAVCGVPKQASKEFILQSENYSRQFYTGFLGELNLNNTSNLFVNLRCMQVLKNTIEIHIGGGITKESNPQSEWEETVAKSKVIRKVL
ncbi:chorismate-binding protein [Aureibaculum sp. 2210JD6-5]|uniref:chorismate-binding protein n=1 Tax=Aureibaculum sp. 2210JD6-5 TaxID=3103957 RepID=UPI002AAD2744|nr:chorismate-binding protein [Aureibaculum sp. 2210JD6-5]MDY7396110.1 chorismate-binding protein [Aureibaculum sp. 2210JD6-5]